MTAASTPPTASSSDTMSGLSYVGDTSGFSHTGSGSGPIVWALGTLPAYSSAEFQVTAVISAPYGQVISNLVQIATDDPSDQGDRSEKWSEWNERGHRPAGRRQLRRGPGERRLRRRPHLLDHRHRERRQHRQGHRIGQHRVRGEPGKTGTGATALSPRAAPGLLPGPTSSPAIGSSSVPTTAITTPCGSAPSAACWTPPRTPSPGPSRPPGSPPRPWRSGPGTGAGRGSRPPSTSTAPGPRPTWSTFPRGPAARLGHRRQVPGAGRRLCGQHHPAPRSGHARQLWRTTGSRATTIRATRSG